MTEESNPSTRLSSVESVLLHSDDILREILLKLHPIVVLRLRTVCKRWHRIISSRTFQNLYLSRTNKSYRPLLGFFYDSHIKRRSKSDSGSSPLLRFISTSNQDTQSLISCDFNGEVVCPSILAVSIQGFVLCGSWNSPYYVCNPSRNQWVQIPQPEKKKPKPFVVGFSCGESDHISTVHFRVIRVFDVVNDSIVVEEFCSKTWDWKERKLSCPAEVHLVAYARCYVFDGVFYFQAKQYEDRRRDVLAIFDPEVEGDSLKWIELISDSYKTTGMALGQSARSGRIELAWGRNACIFKFYSLKDLSQYDDFSKVIHDVWYNWVFLDLTSFISVSRSLARARDDSIPVPSDYSEYPVLLAYHPLDARLVYFRWGGLIFYYSLETFQAMFVKYQDKGSPSSDYDLFPYVQPHRLISLP